MTAPTEQDRAVARRVLRRSANAHPNAGVYATARQGSRWRGDGEPWKTHGPRAGWVAVCPSVMAAAVDGARAGREYRANELKRDADAAHARVEEHTLDRQITHLTKGSK